MKTTILCFTTVLCLVFTGTSLAQEEPHLYTITIWKSVIPENGTMVERDSIAQIFFDATTKNNPKIISERSMVHFYTQDSQEWFIVTEFKNWNDIDEAGKMSDEMLRKAYPDEKKRQELNRMFRKYFPSHSDRIVTDKPKMRK
jgi:hypothetical protein